MIQLGCIPTENVYLILLHNVVDLTVSITAYGLLGYIIAYGNDMFNGILGFGLWINSEDANYENFLFGKFF